MFIDFYCTNYFLLKVQDLFLFYEGALCIFDELYQYSHNFLLKNSKKSKRNQKGYPTLNTKNTTTRNDTFYKSFYVRRKENKFMVLL
jgi:hypothetical protein